MNPVRVKIQRQKKKNW